MKKTQSLDHSSMHHSNMEREHPMHEMTGMEHDHGMMPAGHDTHAGHDRK